MLTWITQTSRCSSLHERDRQDMRRLTARVKHEKAREAAASRESRRITWPAAAHLAGAQPEFPQSTQLLSGSVVNSGRLPLRGRRSGVWIRRARNRRMRYRGRCAALAAATRQTMGQFPVCDFDEYATIRRKCNRTVLVAAGEPTGCRIGVRRRGFFVLVRECIRAATMFRLRASSRVRFCLARPPRRCGRSHDACSPSVAARSS
ncbi:hypothetical protein BLA23254_04294 [Burkholderia lata]|uniref:Uncharacterized protein n=1 Tax=Burkholderia lata (strain ATCC 17760 / DSM 23089 / LMG 22485 / NCIMB 9086 / R18194 / 383) TaxID=482957 RepID=A0A6P2NA42_BURL3|nr:hypothetical protein BLA23254_04294 [Burkholderia lata]